MDTTPETQASPTAPAAEAPEPPMVIVRLLPDGKPQVQVSKGLSRPMANFLLDHGKLLILMAPTDAQPPSLVKPNGHGIAGLMKRAGMR